jgi:hypothetical protein
MKKLLIASAFALAASTSMASAAPKVDCSALAPGIEKTWGDAQAYLKENFGVNNYAQWLKENDPDANVGKMTQFWLGLCGVGSEAP